MRFAHRSIELLVEEQARKWQVRKTDHEAEPQPVRRTITISGEPGSGGSVIAERVAKKLGYDFFDRELIHRTAESAHMSSTMVEMLDEKEHKLLQDWILAFFTDRHLWGDQYLQHLIKVIYAIGRYGGAVVVGRGAAFILPPDRALKVRIVASRAWRIMNLIYEFKITEEEAAAKLKKAEADRVKFIKQYFNQDLTDLRHYDLVIDSGRLGIEGAAQIIVAAEKYFALN